jgi:hypothetical protein
MLKLGDKVRLKACHDSGQPGTLIRFERGRFTVFWADMNYWSKHHPDSLELDQPQRTEVLEK